MAAFTGWKSSKESVLLRFITGGADIKGGQVETLDEYFDADVPRPGTRHFTTHDISLLGTAEFSLPTLLADLNAAAVTSTAALQAQVTQLTAERDEWRAKYEQVAPPATIPAKATNIALHKLELANAWGKAVELTVATLEEAKDEQPKRVYEWWYSVSEINPQGEQWGLIVAEMDKAGMWGRSSEAELLALADQLAGESAAAEPVKG